MRIFKNEQSQKRWRRFWSQKRTRWSVWIILFFIFISATAEVWVNDKPLVLSYQSQLYFPVFQTYHPTVFGQDETLVTQYKTLVLSDRDWAIWPIIRWSPLETDYSLSGFPSPPSRTHFFGTDDRGRDILARLIYGLRYSLGFALSLWLLSYIIGISIGGMMGFFGGWLDLYGQRVIEIIESLPYLMLLIILVASFGSHFFLLLSVTVLLVWTPISFYMRGEFLKLKNLEYVESARAAGGGVGRQMFVHILPNALTPIVTFSPFAIAGGIATLATLDYLGFGLAPPTPSWGELLKQGQDHFIVAWWLAVFPSLALFLSLFVFNMVGIGVRDAFDIKKTLQK